MRGYVTFAIRVCEVTCLETQSDQRAPRWATGFVRCGSAPAPDRGGAGGGGGYPHLTKAFYALLDGGSGAPQPLVPSDHLLEPLPPAFGRYSQPAPPVL